MPRVNFNINNYVEFELTEYGAKILNDKRQKYIDAYPDVECFKETKIVRAGDLHKMQMHGMISAFGEYTSLGLETFCKNATITLEIKDV